jgi:Lon protease-like protein
VEIALFPLNTVLFPGGELDLRIFEPRYLSMVSRCLQQQAPFGVVAIQRGSEVGAAQTFRVGTFAEIVDFRAEPDGLLGLTVAGRGTFRIVHVQRAADGLYVGEVRPRPLDVPRPLEPRFAGLAELLRKLRERAAVSSGAAESYTDAHWIGYRLAEGLPLPLERLQALLETADADRRLAAIAALIESPPDRD